MSLKLLTSNSILWKSYVEYCDERIALAYKALERAETVEEMKEAQGRIRERMKDKSLRDKLEGNKDG